MANRQVLIFVMIAVVSLPEIISWSPDETETKSESLTTMSKTTSPAFNKLFGGPSARSFLPPTSTDNDENGNEAVTFSTGKEAEKINIQGQVYFHSGESSVDMNIVLRGFVRFSGDIKLGDESKERLFKPMTRKSLWWDADPCALGKMNGCSIPLGLPFFYKRRFTPACNRHDVCYFCGANYEMSRLKCDKIFKGDMDKTCVSDSNRLFHAFHNSKRNQEETRLRQDTILRVMDEWEDLLFNIIETEVANLEQEAKGKASTNSTVNIFHVIRENIALLKRRILTKWLIHLVPILQQKSPFRGSSALDTMEWMDPMRVKAPLIKPLIPLTSFQDKMDWNQHQEHYQLFVETVHLADEVARITKGFGVSNTIEFPDFSAIVCRFFADLYYWAVRIFAPFNYDSHSKGKPVCNRPDVRNCLL